MGPADRADASDDASPAVVVTPRADGPLVVDGPVTLTAPDGTTTTHDRLFLCRCGRSATKPLCDGSHKGSGFTAPGVPPTSRRRPAPGDQSAGDQPVGDPDRPPVQSGPDDQPS